MRPCNVVQQQVRKFYFLNNRIKTRFHLKQNVVSIRVDDYKKDEESMFVGRRGTMQLTSKAVLGGYLLATITGPRSTDKLIRAVPALHRSPYLGQVEGVRDRVRGGGGVRVPTTVRTCTILIVGHFRQEIYLLLQYQMALRPVRTACPRISLFFLPGFELETSGTISRMYSLVKETKYTQLIRISFLLAI